MSFKESITSILKFSLLVLFIGYYSNITLFYHAHIINGEVIIHSHFFKSDADTKTPFKNHSHPLSAFNLIYQLNKMNSEEVIAAIPYPQPILPEHLLLRYFVNQNFFIVTNLSIPSRAPPAC